MLPGISAIMNRRTTIKIFLVLAEAKSHKSFRTCVRGPKFT